MGHVGVYSQNCTDLPDLHTGWLIRRSVPSAPLYRTHPLDLLADNDADETALCIALDREVRRVVILYHGATTPHVSDSCCY